MSPFTLLGSFIMWLASNFTAARGGRGKKRKRKKEKQNQVWDGLGGQLKPRCILAGAEGEHYANWEMRGEFDVG